MCTAGRGYDCADVLKVDVCKKWEEMWRLLHTVTCMVVRSAEQY